VLLVPAKGAGAGAGLVDGVGAGAGVEVGVGVGVGVVEGAGVGAGAGLEVVSDEPPPQAVSANSVAKTSRLGFIDECLWIL
jgi:hypothetical protein